MLRFIVLAMLFVTLTTGCSLWRGERSAPKQAAAPLYYVLEVARGEQAKEAVDAPVLRLAPLRVTSQFREKTIMFRVGESSYMPQADHQFLNTPEAILQQQLQSWLVQTGLFSDVVTDPTVAADWVLETAVTAFYGEARASYSPAAVLEMQFFFYSATGKQEEAVLESGLRVSADIAEMTPPEVVIGWRHALLKTLIALEVNLSDYFQQ